MFLIEWLSFQEMCVYIHTQTNTSERDHYTRSRNDCNLSSEQMMSLTGSIQIVFFLPTLCGFRIVLACHSHNTHNNTDIRTILQQRHHLSIYWLSSPGWLPGWQLNSCCNPCVPWTLIELAKVLSDDIEYLIVLYSEGIKIKHS